MARGSNAGANQALQSFTNNLRLATRASGDQWRMQQQVNRTTREGMVTSLAKYRARSAFLGGIAGGAQAIGHGITGAGLRGGGDMAGGMMSSKALTFAATGFMADYMDVGGIFSRAVNPTRQAAGRTKGVMGDIAALGGRIEPGLREALFDITKAQEERRADEERAIDIMAENKFGQGSMGKGMDTALDTIGQAMPEVLGMLRELRDTVKGLLP